jgi:hypothetical protein
MLMRVRPSGVGSKWMIPACATVAPSTVRHANTWFRIIRVTSASNSTGTPAGPATLQCDCPSRAGTYVQHARHETRKVFVCGPEREYRFDRCLDGDRLLNVDGASRPAQSGQPTRANVRDGSREQSDATGRKQCARHITPCRAVRGQCHATGTREESCRWRPVSLQHIWTQTGRRRSALQPRHVAGLFVFLELVHDIPHAANGPNGLKEPWQFGLKNRAAYGDRAVTGRHVNRMRMRDNAAEPRPHPRDKPVIIDILTKPSAAELGGCAVGPMR